MARKIGALWWIVPKRPVTLRGAPVPLMTAVRYVPG